MSDWELPGMWESADFEYGRTDAEEDERRRLADPEGCLCDEHPCDHAPNHRRRRRTHRMKPILLLDMDGPLADFDARFHDLCEEKGWRQHRGAHHRHNPCPDHRFLNDCMLPHEGREARRVVDNTRWFRDLPLTPGAQDGVMELATHFDVWICSKPLETNVWCRDDKAAWIRRHFGPYWERRLILAPNKGLVRGNILLDDAIALEWLPYATWRPVKFQAPFNGPDSIWGGLPGWTWGDPIDNLLAQLEGQD